MFVRISKAHQVLTDESTRLNYEKYGNPDGYQGMKMTT
jgi:preprotein translocase subunit Sec63